MTTSSREALERVAGNFWIPIREGIALETPLQEGLCVPAVFDVMRAADVEPRWVQRERFPRKGWR